MELKDIKTISDVKKGDTIVITGNDMCNEAVKIQDILVSKVYGTEIVFDSTRNGYFNLNMYLENKSWVKECKVLI